MYTTTTKYPVIVTKPLPPDERQWLEILADEIKRYTGKNSEIVKDPANGQIWLATER
jgi:hypothetical protein